MFYSVPPPVLDPGLMMYLMEPSALDAPLTMAHTDKMGPMGKNKNRENLKKNNPKNNVTTPPSKLENASLLVGSLRFWFVQV